MPTHTSSNSTSVPPPRSGDADPGDPRPECALGDFRTDRRMLLLSLLALPLGVLGALVAKALLWLIALLTNFAFFKRWSVGDASPQDHRLGAWVLVVPVVGALIIGFMARYGSEKIRGHGIPEALEAILLGRSRIDPRTAVLKPISSAVSIGTGGPFGAEGPIIMTGGAVGSLFAQLFHLSAAERKTLLVAGAAAGMAAVFATPVAAVLLAVELLLFEWKPRSFVPVALAAVVGSVVRVPLLGGGPIFPVVAHDVVSTPALATAAIVGVAAGLLSGVLTLLVYGCEDQFERLRLHWMWWPALGALAIGIGGWIDPRVLGVGYGTIHGLLHGEGTVAALAGLLLAKGLVWAIALGSGTSGGVLAPLLMMGGALGALVGPRLFGGDASLCAMVGMAAMMGGTMRSPLTAVVFVVELTRDLNALPALLIGTVAALSVTVLWMRRSILTEKLARRGQHVAREYSVDPFEITRVGDVMSHDAPIVSASATVGEVSARIARGDPSVSRRHAALLVDEHGRLIGIVTRGDMVRALESDPEGRTTVASAGRTDLAVTYVDATLHDALVTMMRHDVGRLPVVDRSDPATIRGYLGRAEILAARWKPHDEEERRERGARTPSSGPARSRPRPLAP